MHLLLRVGELAARTGLTVRALHHYDAIGLLQPSARSDAGYRLYDNHDVARLHAIQAMRQLGLPLGEIGGILDGAGNRLPDIVARQIRTIDHEVKQALELREQLVLLQHRFSAGDEPTLDDWLTTLIRMSTYRKHFSAAELRRIFAKQANLAPTWALLFTAVRQAMDEGIPAQALQAQTLARRWLALMLEWMDGDYAVMARWGQMYRAEPGAYGREMPAADMVKYITAAIDLRKAAFLRHMSQDELTQVRPLTADQWHALAQDVQAILQRRESPSSPSAKRLIQRWAAMALAQVGNSRAVLFKMLTAVRTEPLLHAAEGDEAVARGFLELALRAHDDPLVSAQNPA